MPMATKAAHSRRASRPTESTSTRTNKMLKRRTDHPADASCLDTEQKFVQGTAACVCSLSATLAVWLSSCRLRNVDCDIVSFVCAAFDATGPGTVSCAAPRWCAGPVHGCTPTPRISPRVSGTTLDSVPCTLRLNGQCVVAAVVRVTRKPLAGAHRCPKLRAA